MRLGEAGQEDEEYQTKQIRLRWSFEGVQWRSIERGGWSEMPGKIPPRSFSMLTGELTDHDSEISLRHLSDSISHPSLSFLSILLSIAAAQCTHLAMACSASRVVSVGSG
jgi:hypothetical protein